MGRSIIQPIYRVPCGYCHAKDHEACVQVVDGQRRVLRHAHNSRHHAYQQIFGNYEPGKELSGYWCHDGHFISRPTS